jgi:hypothetical protein
MGMKAQIQNRNEEFFKLSAVAIESVANPTVSEQQFHDYIRELLVIILSKIIFIFMNSKLNLYKFELIKGLHFHLLLSLCVSLFYNKVFKKNKRNR